MTDNTTALTDLQAAVNSLESSEAKALAYLAGLPALLTSIGANAPADVSAQLETLASQIGGDAANLTNGVSLAPTIASLSPAQPAPAPDAPAPVEPAAPDAPTS